MKTKTDRATEVINLIRTIEPSALWALILKEAGEELTTYFMEYSAGVVKNSGPDPEKVLGNVCSLMLLGYLVRASEEKQTSLTMKEALA